MGCDIHCYAEVKRGNRWVKVGKVFTNTWYRPEKKVEKWEKWNKPKTDQPYDNRNYDLYGILANVRNGRGFAGCDMGDGFIPIDMPRGLPSDVSDKVKKISDGWGCDGHSHSYFTLEELLKYNWTQIVKQRGVVSEEEYRKWKEKGGEPESYCGGVGGGYTKMVSNSELEKIMEEKSKAFATTKGIGLKKTETEIQYYTQVEWTQTYAQAVGKDFFTRTLPELAKLGKSDKVRIVFWFDN